MSIIHNLVARFRADTGAFDRKVKGSRKQMTRFGRDVKMMGRQMLAVAGVGGGVYMLKRGIVGVTKAAIEQEKAEKLLQATVKGSIAAFKRFAAETQKLTIYGDEQILSQMAYARNLGVTEDKLKAATTAAIGLAAKYRLDLATSMMLVGRASQGQTQMLTRYGITLDESLTSQEKFNKLLQIGAQSFGLAEKEAETAAGSIQQMKNAIGDTAETIGNVLLPSIRTLSREVTGFLTSNSVALKRYASDYVEGVGMMLRASPLGLAKSAYDKWKNRNAVAPKKLGERMAAEPAQSGLSAALSAKGTRDIHTKYQTRIETEIRLMGKVGEARKRAADVIRYENELIAAGVTDKEWLLRYTGAFEKQLIKLGKHQRLVEIANDIGDAFGNAFTDMIFEAKKFGDVMKALMKDIARSVISNLITVPLSQNIAAGIGGMFGVVPATVKHSGGMVGAMGRSRNVSAAAFAGAPKLHSGLMGDEYPAVLQRGEQVIPKGGGGSAPMIVINNQSGNKMRLDGQPQFDGKQWVIAVVADNIDSGGKLRKMVQSVR